MFLKVATALAIAGLLAGIFLSILRELLAFSLYRSGGYLWFFRGIGILLPIVVYVPLVVFLVAFFLSLRSRQS